LSADGVAFLDPVNDVQIVDVLLDDMVAANPGEVVPVAHLVFHFGELVAALLFEIGAPIEPGRLAVPIAAHGYDVANGAVVEPLEGLAIAFVIMPLQTDDYLKPFLFGFRSRGHEAPDAGGIGGDGFFGENIFALLDRFLELHGTKTGRRSQDDYIGQSDGLFIGVETDKLAIGRHVHFFLMDSAEIIEAAFEFIFEGIRHGHELDGAFRFEGLVGGAGAASAATDQGKLEGVGPRGEGAAFDGQTAEH